MTRNDRLKYGIKIGSTVFGFAYATVSSIITKRLGTIALTWTITLGVLALLWAADWFVTWWKSRLAAQAKMLEDAEKRAKDTQKRAQDLEEAQAAALAQVEELKSKLTKAEEQAQLQSQFCIRYVGDLNTEEGQGFLVENRLEDLKAGRVRKIEIVARTAFCWLGGDEKKGDIDDEAFKKDHERLLRDLEKALAETSGGISLVIQNPDVGGPSFTAEENEKLRKHGEYVIESFKEVSRSLSQADAKKISLRITDLMIVNSMVLSTSRENRRTLTFDLESSFRYVPTTGNKPFLVFDGIGDNASELRGLFGKITEGSISLEDFEKRDVALKGIEREIENHSKCFSILRQDHSKRLAYAAARSFLSEKMDRRVLPPVCVQFLVTDRCTTNCIMCGHYKIGANKPDPLSLAQTQAILKSIASLGTRAVVISGGEPLIRDDLPEILRYGRSNQRLRLGLLTNGVSNGGKEADDDVIDAIVETCDWVQVSIDSFDPQVYRTIRQGDYLHVAQALLKKLREKREEKKKDKNDAASLKHIELCYTIQRANIDRLGSDIEMMLKELDREISIRLKIAHGPKNGKDFLLEESKKHVASLKKVLQDYSAEGRVNAEYLLKMIKSGYFDESDIYGGTPTRRTMEGGDNWDGYARRGYVCHILRHTCVIDAKGDIYPCCFLFDDNHGRFSKIRTMYKIEEPDPDQVSKCLSASGNRPAFSKLLASNNLAARWHVGYRKYVNGQLEVDYRQKTVPVDEKACWFCTRHFYQNELLNEVCRVFSEHEDWGLAKEFVRRCEKDPEMKEPFWL